MPQRLPHRPCLRLSYFNQRLPIPSLRRIRKKLDLSAFIQHDEPRGDFFDSSAGSEAVVPKEESFLVSQYFGDLFAFLRV